MQATEQARAREAGRRDRRPLKYRTTMTGAPKDDVRCMKCRQWTDTEAATPYPAFGGFMFICPVCKTSR